MVQGLHLQGASEYGHTICFLSLDISLDNMTAPASTSCIFRGLH